MSDLTKGRTFGLTEQVTAAKLHSLIEDAVINPEFVTSKAVATPVAADSVVFHSAAPGALRKCTTAAFRTFVSPMTALGAIAITQGTSTFATSFSAKPTFVAAVLVCGTADLGYLVGAEIPASAAGDISGKPAFAWDVTSSLATIVCLTASFYIPNAGLGGDYGLATSARWTIKLICFTP